MTHEELCDQLIKMVCTDLLKRPTKRIGQDDPIISSGLIDSFNLVDLSILIENQYGVRIEDSELSSDTFDSISQLARLIQARQR